MMLQVLPALSSVAREAMQQIISAAPPPPDLTRRAPTLEEEGGAAAMPRIAEQVMPAAAFPLRMGHALSYAKHRTALVGDAAHTVHPLAGQGLNLGLCDVASLVHNVASGVAVGMDPGSAVYLSHYDRHRRPANMGMSALVHSTWHLFRAGSLSGARVAGMATGDSLVDLKRRIMRFAMADDDRALPDVLGFSDPAARLHRGNAGAGPVPR